jgi:hypothetical protein
LKVAVRRAFASALLSLLLLTTLVWGGCISCDQYFMWPGAKSCCSPDGHCKTKTSPESSKCDCTQIAFDQDKSLDFSIDLPVIAVVKIELPTRAVDPLERWRGATSIEPSPPDLQILNSTFLV